MTIESGSLVLLEYIAKLADGTVTEGAHRDGDPASGVTTGLRLVSVGDPAYPVIKGLDKALADAEVNSPQTVTVQPADAYGDRRRDKIKMLPIRKLEDENTRVGDEVTVGGEKGVVLSMGSGRVRIDFNHKHAGKSLTFDFTVLKHLESDADKVLAMLINAEILPESDLSSMYKGMEGAGDDDFDLGADLDDDLGEDLDDDLDDDLGEDLDDDLDDDLEAELDKDLDAGDESKDAELGTALDDDDLDAELDKALDRDLGLDDKEDNLDAEPAKDLDDGLESDLEAGLGGDREESLEAELEDPGTDDESKDDDRDLEDILGLDDDDLDLDDKDLEAEDLDLDNDLDDLDLGDDDKDLDDDLDDLDDDLDDLDDLDDDDLDDLDDEDLDDLDEDLDDNAGGLDPYANITGYMLANNVLTVEIPPSMHRSPNIQTKKFTLQMELFKFVPNLKVVRFVETHQNVAA